MFKWYEKKLKKRKIMHSTYRNVYLEVQIKKLCLTDAPILKFP